MRTSQSMGRWQAYDSNALLNPKFANFGFEALRRLRNRQVHAAVKKAELSLGPALFDLDGAVHIEGQAECFHLDGGFGRKCVALESAARRRIPHGLLDL